MRRACYVHPLLGRPVDNFIPPHHTPTRFVAEGVVHKFDIFAAITAVVNLVVLVGLARVVVDAVLFNIPYYGAILTTKREERTNARMAFAELGMHAAPCVSQFQKIDSDNTGTLSLEDISRLFGGIKTSTKGTEITPKKAMEIAKTIMECKRDKTSDGLTFNE